MPADPSVPRVPRTLTVLKVPRALWAPAVLPDPTAPWMPADHSALKVPRTPPALRVFAALWVLRVLSDPTVLRMPEDLTDLKAPHPQWVLVDPRHQRVSMLFAALWDPSRPEDPTVPRELNNPREDKSVVDTACLPDKLTEPLLVTEDVSQETLSMAPDTLLPAAETSHSDPAVNPVVTRAAAPPHTQTVTDTLADTEAPGEQSAHLAFLTRATTLVRIIRMAQ